MRDASGTSLLNQPRDRSLDKRFRTLYDTHRCRVRGLIRKRFSDDAVVDDLVQEVFARAYTALPSLDPETPPWPWLAAVARNLCADEFRRRSRESFPPLPSAATADDPETRALAGVRRSEVVEALTAIHPRQAELLVRRHIDGLGYHELAALDGSSVTVVKSVLGRARRRFREHYREIVERAGFPVIATVAAFRDWLELRTRRMTAAASVPEAAAAAHSAPGTVSAAAVTVAAGVAALLGPQIAAPVEGPRAQFPRAFPAAPSAVAHSTQSVSEGSPPAAAIPGSSASEALAPSEDAPPVAVEIAPIPDAAVIAPPESPMLEQPVAPSSAIDEIVDTDTSTLPT